MKCKDCSGEMDFEFCHDSPNEGFAYNVYHCFNCMIIAKENVWDNEGVLWIAPDNTTEIKERECHST